MALGPSPHVDHPELLARLEAGFTGMPGLRLTVPQAARLFDLESPLCERLLGVLVDGRTLSRSPDGRYGRWQGE